jgi:hypothetical protein
MSAAVVFCLACQRVMNITEYIHPGHRCVQFEENKLVKREPQPQLFDGDDVA